MELEDSIGYWLSYAQRYFASALFEVIRAHCVERGKPYVITPQQWVVIALLSRRDRQTISSLAQQLGLDGPAVTNIAKRLEQSGLVTRARSREDERVVEVRLSAEGWDIFRSLNPLVVQFHKQVLSDDQRHALLEHLQQFIARVSMVAPGAGDRFSSLLEHMRRQEHEHEG
jgi:MarR family transcriptional regulator, organic hydroperoxide resistance regulator